MYRLRTKLYNFILIIRRNYLVHVKISISLSLAIASTVLLIFAGKGKHNYCTHYYYRSSAGNVKSLYYIISKKDYYRDSRDMGKRLENTRLQIKNQLSKYNFSLSGARVLEDLVMEAGGRPLQSLIISTWRSGTTFLGELLNAIPGTFYHYEPLLKYGIIQIRAPPESDEALSTIKAMFKCNYDGLHDYFVYGNNHTHQFAHNTRLWDHCKFKKDMCYDADFTSRLCKLFPFHVMKIVRLRLRFIQEILDDKELLRYEELALNPKLTSHSILKFLKLRPTPSIDQFIKSHTNVEVTDVKSTFRVSHEVPFKWKYKLGFNYVDEIQVACKEAMLLWGYKEAHNKTHLASEDFNPIENSPILR